MAQLSQGPCFLVTASSYVLRKLESRRGCGAEAGAGRGLSGGVSMADGLADTAVFEDRSKAARCACASRSDVVSASEPRSRFFRASFKATDEWDVALSVRAFVRGPSSDGGTPSSKHTVHEAGRPSVTMRGVGPWMSQ